MTNVVLAGSLDDINSDIKARLGLEFNWKVLKIVSLSGRIGSNQGYPTLGAGIKVLFLNFDYAFYGDEITDWHAFSFNLAF
jgi:hypothetical protein